MSPWLRNLPLYRTEGALSVVGSGILGGATVQDNLSWKNYQSGEATANGCGRDGGQVHSVTALLLPAADAAGQLLHQRQQFRSRAQVGGLAGILPEIVEFVLAKGAVVESPPVRVMMLRTRSLRAARASSRVLTAARYSSQGSSFNLVFPISKQLGFRLNSILFDNKEWPSTLLHTHVFASSTALFFRIITISMFTFTD